ncbi:hypothetical protein IWX50DRAFT_352354 [Phyllosticta citricarpa]
MPVIRSISPRASTEGRTNKRDGDLCGWTGVEPDQPIRLIPACPPLLPTLLSSSPHAHTHVGRLPLPLFAWLSSRLTDVRLASLFPVFPRLALLAHLLPVFCLLTDGQPGEGLFRLCLSSSRVNYIFFVCALRCVPSRLFSLSLSYSPPLASRFFFFFFFSSVLVSFVVVVPIEEMEGVRGLDWTGLNYLGCWRFLVGMRDRGLLERRRVGWRPA